MPCVSALSPFEIKFEKKNYFKKQRIANLLNVFESNARNLSKERKKNVSNK